ncbi:MAG: hypothetical protein AAGI38_13655 [Bacteroidota bacterium]
MKYFILLLLGAAMSFPMNLTAQEYYFLALEDCQYDNPANWYPVYPGEYVQPGTKVVIQEDASLGSIELEVDGELIISPGSMLSAHKGSIQVNPNARLTNHGMLMAKTLHNQGAMHNGQHSYMLLVAYYGYKNAIMDQPSQARCIVLAEALGLDCRMMTRFLNASSLMAMAE